MNFTVLHSTTRNTRYVLGILAPFRTAIINESQGYFLQKLPLVHARRLLLSIANLHDVK